MACSSEVQLNFFYKTHSFSRDYRIQNTVLGDGISGQVKLCQRKANDCLYALKVLEDRDKDRRELTIYSHVNREIPDCVVPLIDIYRNKVKKSEGEYRYYVVMKWMAGGDLYTRLDQQDQFKERDAAQTLAVICHLIKQLHALDIVHMDIKPENFMYGTVNGGPETLRIGDFGGAMFLNSDRFNHTLSTVTTCYYAAPEVVISSDNGVKESDVWSIGICLYLLLSGDMPFFSDDKKEVKECVKQGKIIFKHEFWHNVSSEAMGLVRRILQRMPYERPTLDQITNDNWVRRYSPEQEQNS